MTSESTNGSHRLAWCWWAGLLVFLALTVACPTKSVMADEPVPRGYTYAGDGRAGSGSAGTLREISLMRLTRWPEGERIRVFVLPDNHPLHVRFAKEVLGVYPFHLRAAWDRLIFSGTGLVPHVVETVGEMRERVR